MNIYIFVEIVFMYVDLDVFFQIGACIGTDGRTDAPRYISRIHHSFIGWRPGAVRQPGKERASALLALAMILPTAVKGLDTYKQQLVQLSRTNTSDPTPKKPPKFALCFMGV